MRKFLFILFTLFIVNVYADNTSVAVCVSSKIDGVEHRSVHPVSMILGAGLSAVIIVSGLACIAPPSIIIGGVIFIIYVEIIRFKRDR
jgi:hypothetical protein